MPLRGPVCPGFGGTVTTTASPCTPSRPARLTLSPSCSCCRPKSAAYVITADVAFVLIQSVAQHVALTAVPPDEADYLRRRTAVEPRLATDMSLQVLFAAHRHNLLRLAVLFVDSKTSAEDCVQEAFLALWTAMRRQDQAKLRDENAALAYLRRCVVNGGRSELRRRRTARGKAHLLLIDEEPSAEDTALTPIIVSAEHAAVMAALKALPARQRQVMVLTYYEHLTSTEIADTLGISEGHVRRTAFDARRTLGHTLGHLR